MGRLDVDAMLSEMTASQLTEWAAYASLEPWGTDVDDQRAGVIAATVANMAGKVLPKGKELSPGDLFPDRLPKPEPEVDLRAQVHAIFGPMAGRDPDPPPSAAPAVALAPPSAASGAVEVHGARPSVIQAKGA